MTRSSGSSSSGASAARIDVVRRALVEPRVRADLDAAVRADQHVAGDQRRVLRQPPERLVDLGHDERLDAGRQPRRARGVALDQLGDAALVPRDGEQNGRPAGRAARRRGRAPRGTAPAPPARAGRSGRWPAAPRSRHSRPPAPSRRRSFQSGCGAVQRQRPGTISATFTRSTASGSIRPSSIVQPASASEPSERIRYGLPCQRPMFSTSVREGRGGEERCEWKTASS